MIHECTDCSNCANFDDGWRLICAAEGIKPDAVCDYQPPFGYDVIVSTQERRVAISTLIGFDGVSPRWELYENGEHLICPLDYIVAWQPMPQAYDADKKRATIRELVDREGDTWIECQCGRLARHQMDAMCEGEAATCSSCGRKHTLRIVVETTEASDE